MHLPPDIAPRGTNALHLFVRTGITPALERIMNHLVALVLSVMLLGAGEAMAQDEPPTPPNPPSCEPCWIEPRLCKKPTCPHDPIQPLGSNTQPQSRDRPRFVHKKLTGTVKAFGIVQEEPAETPQANFYLQVREPDGRLKDILVSMPEYDFPCSEGERATLVGDLTPDDAKMPTVLLSARLVSCKIR